MPTNRSSALEYAISLLPLSEPITVPAAAFATTGEPGSTPPLLQGSGTLAAEQSLAVENKSLSLVGDSIRHLDAFALGGGC